MTALGDRAEEFAEELSALVSAFRGVSTPFTATRAGTRYSITPNDPVTLTVDGQELLSLDISYRCEQDRSGE